MQASRRSSSIAQADRRPVRSLVVGGDRHLQGPADWLDPEALAMLLDKALTSFGLGELGREKGRSGLENFVGPAQLAHLTT